MCKSHQKIVPLRIEINNLMTTDEFILKAKQVHGDRYDYSKAEYIGYKDDICIICPEHGAFGQKAKNHLLLCQ